MTRIPLIFSMIAAAATIGAYAQTPNEVDVLRFSQTTFNGTARYNSMAGAFGALGADFSTLSSNPAGLGLYRSSEISFTPTSLNQTTSSNYMSTGGSNSTTESASKYSTGVANLGLVGSWHTQVDGQGGGWQNFNMAFGYNQLANYNNSMNSQGYNYSNASLPNVLSNYNTANGTLVNNMDPTSYAAYQAYLIDNPQGGTQYVSYLPTGGVFQQNSVTSSGSMGELVLSFGGNYNNKLYLGGTIGFDYINYTSNSTYSETALKDSAGGVNTFSLDQRTSTTGNGVNLKLGIIYRVNDWMRIGLAANSPTQFNNMNEQYTTSVNTQIKDTSLSYTSFGSYHYNMTTPGRIIGSIGFVIAKRGLIDIDYEYVDYTSATLSSGDPGLLNAANTAIQNKYTATGNIRVGGEFKLIDNVSIRAGYAYYGNPYQSDVNINASRTSYTAGLGFREKTFYIDLAYVLTQYNENYYYYDPAIVSVNPVKNTFNLNSLMLTLGLKF